MIRDDRQAGNPRVRLYWQVGNRQEGRNVEQRGAEKHRCQTGSCDSYRAGGAYSASKVRTCLGHEDILAGPQDCKDLV